MDHLDIPERCKPQMRPVPYFGIAAPYDALGLDGFPARQGIDEEELRRLLETQAPARLEHWYTSFRHFHGDAETFRDWLDSFFQEWLWFGLLDEFAKSCGISINRDDFIADGESRTGRLLTTKTLYDVYARRAAFMELARGATEIGLEVDDLLAIPGGSHDDTCQQIEDLLKQKRSGIRAIDGAIGPENVLRRRNKEKAAPVLISLCHRIKAARILAAKLAHVKAQAQDAQGEDRLGQSIVRAQTILRKLYRFWNKHVYCAVRFRSILSIDILCHTLAGLLVAIKDQKVSLRSPHLFPTFEAQKLQRNWCPRRDFTWRTERNTRLDYVVSLLPSHETISHHDCSEIECKRRPPRLSDVMPLHREDCDGACSFFTIPQDQLTDMWRSGGIPGLRRRQGSNEQVEVVDCSENPYIAISHVWTHGLGNSASNSLPQCQLSSLLHLIDDLHQHQHQHQQQGKNSDDPAATVLWLDTLSVPTDPQAKRLALPRLRTVYSQARTVLVLDKHLMQVDGAPSNRAEQILQVLASEWQKRLWTLQEGRLAQQLVFKFKDAFVSVADLLSTTNPDASDSSAWTHSGGSALDFYAPAREELRGRFTMHPTIHRRWADLVKDAATRSCAVPSDEPICFATMLGLSLEALPQAPLLSMADIYRALPEAIPQDLMFYGYPKIVGVPGLGWAPASFINRDAVGFLMPRGQEPGRLVEEGLVIRKDALMLEGENYIDFRGGGRERLAGVYVVRVAFQGLSFGIRVNPSTYGDSRSFEVERTGTGESARRSVVVLEMPFDELVGKGIAHAALVSIEEGGGETTSGGARKVRFDEGLGIWIDGTDNVPVSELRKRGASERIMGHAEARVERGLAFCVG